MRPGSPCQVRQAGPAVYRTRRPRGVVGSDALPGRARNQNDLAARRWGQAPRGEARARPAAGLSLQADVLRPNDKLAAGWISAGSRPPTRPSRTTTNLDRAVGNQRDLARPFRALQPAALARAVRPAGWWGGLGQSHGGQRRLRACTTGRSSARAPWGAGISLRSPGLRFWQSPSAPFGGRHGPDRGRLRPGVGQRLLLEIVASEPRRQTPSPQAPSPSGTSGAARPTCASRLGIAF
jgi:hypothetical protein